MPKPFVSQTVWFRIGNELCMRDGLMGQDMSDLSDFQETYSLKSHFGLTAIIGPPTQLLLAESSDECSGACIIPASPAS